MTCREFIKAVSGLMEGYTSSEAVAIAIHYKNCHLCRKAFDGMVGVANENLSEKVADAERREGIAIAEAVIEEASRDNELRAMLDELAGS